MYFIDAKTLKARIFMLFELSYTFIRPTETKPVTVIETRDSKETAQARWSHARWVMARKGYKYLGGYFRRLA